MRNRHYNYFILCFLILVVVVAFYLSCKSKSPTEPASSLPNQIATQSTNNTTTSSSTTTSVKPGQSPTNTTTLITSRYLTTTSTSTTTTSSIPTTTTTTTVAAYPDIRTTFAVADPWCFYAGKAWVIYYISCANFGDAPAYDVKIKVKIKSDCPITPTVDYFNVGTLLPNGMVFYQNGGHTFLVSTSTCTFKVKLFAIWQGVDSWQLLHTKTVSAGPCQ